MQQNVDGPRDYHVKWSKPDREIQILYDISDVILSLIWTLKKKNDTNELIYKTETDSRTQIKTFGYQRGWGGQGKR